MSMRKNKGVNANMNFLFGGVLLFFVLVLIVGLFSFFTLQQFWHSDESVKVAEVTKRYDYSVAFDSSFKGKSYKLYLNDSLVYVGTPVDVDTVIKLRRIAVDNSLLVQPEGETENNFEKYPSVATAVNTCRLKQRI